MRVVVAMSGGVDSSVAAGLLAEQGHVVIGVHLKLHDAVEGSAGHCCGLDDVLDARGVADRLGFPFYVYNLKEAFQAAVIDDFVRAWRAGETPNPCVVCNGVLKFDILLKRARSLGAEAIATGHYARTAHGRLYASAHPDKDQSYFLYPVRPEALARTLFPLGGMTKPEVRRHAVRLGLATAEKPESMDVCFLPDDDHTRLVSAAVDVDGAGEIVDEAGRVLGRHDAYWRFTIGQRRGIGVAAPDPLYVLAVDPSSRRVTVGPEARLYAQELVAGGVNWIRRPEPGEALTVRIRHRGARIPCEVLSDDPIRLRLSVPARAITAGQAAVLYADDEVVGGGTIRRTP